jgi:hypothetical protein
MRTWSLMENEFILPVCFQGNDLEFPAQIVQLGYVVKLMVIIEGVTVTFEPDEERNWRAVIAYDDLMLEKKLKKELVEAVAEAIGSFSK